MELNTWEYMAIQRKKGVYTGNTWECRGIHGNTVEYRGINGNAGEGRGIDGNTGEYRGVQENTCISLLVLQDQNDSLQRRANW